MRRLLPVLGLALVLWPGPGRAQSRVVTTIAAIQSYPVFFHGRQVVIRGALRRHDRTAVIVAPNSDKVLYLLLGGVAADDGDVEVRGDLYDLGRLAQDDPRLAGVDVEAVLQLESPGRWPNQGDLPVLKVGAVEPARPSASPSLRALALEPDRYEGQRVSVVGRFRGANLYGDLPDAPGKSRWDFVLQSADAAVWVTDLRPRARDLDLDPRARVDTGRWIQVAGVVRVRRGLVLMEGQTVAEATPPEETPTEPVAVVPVVAPPPQVVFSAPIPDDTDVSPAIAVRIQFSRDMDAGSFGNRIQVTYFGAAAGAPAPPAFRTRYRREDLVLELTFAAPLERFRTVRVELLDGITAADGAPLGSWSLTFSVGAGRN